MIKTRACAANAPTDPEQISHSGILPAMKRSRTKSQVTIVTGSSDVQGSNVPHFYTPHGLPEPSNQFLCLGKISYLIFLKPFYFFWHKSVWFRIHFTGQGNSRGHKTLLGTPPHAGALKVSRQYPTASQKEPPKETKDRKQTKSPVTML